MFEVTLFHFWDWELFVSKTEGTVYAFVSTLFLYFASFLKSKIVTSFGNFVFTFEFRATYVSKEFYFGKTCFSDLGLKNR